MSRRLLAVLILASSVIKAGCAHDYGGEPPREPWRSEGWFSVSIKQYDQPPPRVVTKNHPPLWSIMITGYYNIAVKGVYAGVDELGGAGALTRIQQMDTITLRKRYAESLTPAETIEERLRSKTFSWPVQVASIGITHWEGYSVTMKDDPAAATPLVGSVVLPIGSEPGIPANAELDAVIAEFQRLADAAKTYQPPSPSN